MPNRPLLLALFATLFSLGAHAQKAHSLRAITKLFAMDTVMRIPEIRAADLYIRHETKGKRHLFSMIYGDPDKENPYYWVVVGEDNGMSFVTHFTFYVYIKSGKILYYDSFKGTRMELQSWRSHLARK